jgi:hypothetical protein
MKCFALVCLYYLFTVLTEEKKTTEFLIPDDNWDKMQTPPEMVNKK